MPIELTKDSPDIFNLAIKLAFFDIDGTLVASNGQISPQVKQALSNLSQCGCRLAFASGRPYFSAKELIQQLNINAPSVFYSGSLIFDPLTSQVLRTIKIS